MASWLVWGAKLFGWAPTVTKEQQHGDLVRMSDQLLQDVKRTEGAR